MKKFLLFIALGILSAGTYAQKGSRNADPITVKVAVVIQDPMLPNGKRMHQSFTTPGVKGRVWNDPRKLMLDYRDSLKSLSGGVINYEIVKVYDDDFFFSRMKNSDQMLTKEEMARYLAEPDWATFRSVGTTFDYNKFIDHYGFCEMRDRGEIQEVWLWTVPFGGTWESTYAGNNAFWLNSDPVEGTSCKDLLVVMGLNYEREMSLALESYGHRFESVMRKVYGRWDHMAPKLNNWEIFTSYDKITPGKAYVGNIHFPPNGLKDYDWKNHTPVKTNAAVWANYPDLSGDKTREVTCADWDCSHLGYMTWWYRHVPHFKGLNPADGHLNNWWHYVVDYNAAMKKERELQESAKGTRSKK